MILVVDDDENVLEVISTKFAASGFDVAVARNADQGVEQAERIMPDLILMDIHMPGASGTDAALQIKQNKKTKNIKIAFFTSLTDPWPSLSAENKKTAKNLGMEDYIQKTDDLDVVVSKTKEILAQT